MAAITVKMSNFSGAQMSTTFDQNLNAPGPSLTVLDSVQYRWHQTANVWNDIGLQLPYPYNGVDNLVVEFLVVGSAGAGGGLHREGTNQRVYLGGYTGQLVGTNGGNSAFKMRLLTGDASTMTFGAGCSGSNGVPVFSFGGTGQIGTVLGCNGANAPSLAPALLLMGSNTRLPVYPLDLSPFGATGCTLYHDVRLAFAVGADASGRLSLQLPLPRDQSLVCVVLYFSYVIIDPAANSAFLTTSNYGRALLGN
jgi:hypothetical protein